MPVPAVERWVHRYDLTNRGASLYMHFYQPLSGKKIYQAAK